MFFFVVPGGVGAIAFLVILAYSLWQALPGAKEAGAATPFAIQQFSVEFLNEYWVQFEFVSVLLVAAVVSALAVLEVGRRHRG